MIGGKLVVWSPDANEQFPTEYGADGLLFTNDDPLGPIPVGYSIVDLDKKPFAISRDPTSGVDALRAKRRGDQGLFHFFI